MPCSTGIGFIAWIVLRTITVTSGQTIPLNAVAKIGEGVIFSCSDLGFYPNWIMSKDGTSTNQLVIAAGCVVNTNLQNHYDVDKTGGPYVCNLIVSNVTMDQAGVYWCVGSGDRSNALLTVLDPNVVVYNRSEIVEGDQLFISCSINYTGPASPAPSLRPLPHWTTSPGQIYSSTIIHTSTNVNLMATVTVQKYTVPIFQCDTVFEITGNTYGYNSTAPADKLNVSSTTELYVQYPVENISIHSTVPTTEYKCVAKTETLTCSANGNPPAQYVWLDLQNKITTTGAVLSISSGGQYKCTAFNIIRNQSYNATETATEISCYISDHVRPSNAVTKFGGGAILNCSDPSFYPDWIMSKDGKSTNRLTIAVGCNVSETLQYHYDVDKVGGLHVCSLIVSKATMDQGGVYWCNGSSDPYKALLTVLDSSPTITYNNAPMEGLDVVITCALNHYGSVEPFPTLRPYFYWTDNTGDNASNVYNPPPSNNSVVSQLTVTAGREDIMPYTCHVYMQLMPTTSPGYADNIPSVNSSAISPTITVLYPVGKITITSTTDGCVNKTETLTCTADANPPAQYVWLDMNNNISTTGAVLSISSGGDYQCIASNSIRSQTYYEKKTVTEISCPGVSLSFEKVADVDSPSSHSAGSSSLVWRKLNYLQLSLVCSLMNYIHL